VARSRGFYLVGSLWVLLTFYAEGSMFTGGISSTHGDSVAFTKVLTTYQMFHLESTPPSISFTPWTSLTDLFWDVWDENHGSNRERGSVPSS
jgi:hypothetical protein